MLVSKNIHVSINIFNYYCNDKKDDNIKYYIRVLSFCGMIIALYQCIIQYFAIKVLFVVLQVMIAHRFRPYIWDF